jgi:SAM-dependent methyltransferase
VNPDELWLAEVWPFVRSQIPVMPSLRVLEVGCGPFGGFVPMLRHQGHDAVGVDPCAPAGSGFHRVEFERYDPPQHVAVVVACTSLHHVADLDEALNKIRAVLAPGGLVVVVEWAWECTDETTARWCFDRLDPNAEPNWLQAMRDGWVESDRTWSVYLNAWAADQGLHSSEQIRRGLDERFDCMVSAQGPYYFPDLDDTTAAEEQAAIDASTIRATATYYVGRTRNR